MISFDMIQRVKEFIDHCTPDPLLGKPNETSVSSYICIERERYMYICIERERERDSKLALEFLTFSHFISKDRRG